MAAAPLLDILTGKISTWQEVKEREDEEKPKQEKSFGSDRKCPDKCLTCLAGWGILVLQFLCF